MPSHKLAMSSYQAKMPSHQLAMSSYQVKMPSHKQAMLSYQLARFLTTCTDMKSLQTPLFLHRHLASSDAVCVSVGTGVVSNTEPGSKQTRLCAGRYLLEARDTHSQTASKARRTGSMRSDIQNTAEEKKRDRKNPIAGVLFLRFYRV